MTDLFEYKRLCLLGIHAVSRKEMREHFLGANAVKVAALYGARPLQLRQILECKRRQLNSESVPAALKRAHLESIEEVAILKAMRMEAMAKEAESKELSTHCNCLRSFRVAILHQPIHRLVTLNHTTKR